MRTASASFSGESGGTAWNVLASLCAVAILFVVVDSLSMLQLQRRPSAATPIAVDNEIMRIYLTGSLMVGVLFWPILWNVALGKGHLNGGARLLGAPKLLLGFAWPLVMLIGDLNYASKKLKDPTFFEALNRLGYLQTDANTIITAAFAIGTLLVTLKKSRKAQGVNVVMYALLLCVAFVIPSSEAPATSRTSIIIRTCQKVCLNYAIGFIISGITLDLVT